MNTAFKFHSLENVTREYLIKMRDEPQLLIGTGIPSVDEMLGGGIAKGEVCIVGARPSHGKTMFGLQWCYNAAASGHPCLIVSEEMSADMLGCRAMQHATSIPESKRLERWDDLFDGVSTFFTGKRPILIPERRCGSAASAADAIAQAKANHGIRLAVVDYLQLLRGRGNSRYEQVSDVSQVLKSAAVDNNVALVVLAQLSRQVEEREQFIPKLNDLRDSGQIEQDADCVLFLAWPWKVDKSIPPSEYRIYGAKNRNRGIRGNGVAMLDFDCQRQLLTDKRPANYDESFDTYNQQETF